VSELAERLGLTLPAQKKLLCSGKDTPSGKLIKQTVADHLDEVI
jgi:hypothetical protein